MANELGLVGASGFVFRQVSPIQQLTEKTKLPNLPFRQKAPEWLRIGYAERAGTVRAHEERDRLTSVAGTLPSEDRCGHAVVSPSPSPKR